MTLIMFDIDIIGLLKCKLLGWHGWVYDEMDGYILKTCERCSKQKKVYHKPLKQKS
jgi:hypothetical protein